MEHQEALITAPLDAPWLGTYVDESGTVRDVPVDDSAVMYPASDDEFERMIQQFESEGLSLED